MSKAVGLRRALVGWSIPLTSEGTAKRICRHGYESIEQLQAATVEELCEVEDVGPVVAQALREFLDQPAMRAEITALRELGVSLDVREEDRPVEALTDSPFAGKTVVDHGHALGGTQRVPGVARGRRREGVAGRSRPRPTTSSPASPPARNSTKAESLGVAVLTEDEARAMLAA